MAVMSKVIPMDSSIAIVQCRMDENRSMKTDSAGFIVHGMKKQLLTIIMQVLLMPSDLYITELIIVMRKNGRP